MGQHYLSFYSSSSQPKLIFVFKEHLTIIGYIFDWYISVLTATEIWCKRPGVLLNILPCPGQSLKQRIAWLKISGVSRLKTLFHSQLHGFNTPNTSKTAKYVKLTKTEQIWKRRLLVTVHLIQTLYWKFRLRLVRITCPRSLSPFWLSVD